MAEPLVSIALALYNGENHIAEQLKSILAQTHRDLEIVVLDDASQDKGLATVESFSKGDSRIRVHRNEKNLGLALNFLKSVSLCHGEFVCFSDQDDVWNPDKIEVLLKKITSNERNMLVYSDLDVDGSSFWSVSKIRPRKGSLWPEAVLRNPSPGCAMLFRRPVADLLARAALDVRFLEKGRLDDVAFMHDHLAFIFACALGRVDYSTERLVSYRQHDSNSIGAFYKADKRRSHLVDGLRAKIRFLREYLPPKDPGLSELDAFVDSLENPELFNAMRWKKFYLSLRRDTLQEKALGLAEAVLPGPFQKMREGKR